MLIAFGLSPLRVGPQLTNTVEKKRVRAVLCALDMLAASYSRSVVREVRICMQCFLKEGNLLYRRSATTFG